MRQPKDEFDLLQWVIVVGVIAAAIAALIEFNARRTARANMAELERALTITPETAAKMDADIARMNAEFEAQLRRPARRNAARQAYDPTPLRPGERCIQHQRFRRVDNGWEQIGTCR